MGRQVVDSSVAAVNGAAVGGLASDAVVSKYGGTSLLFNGTTSFALFAANPRFAVGTGDFTISFWVKTTQSVTGQIAFPRIVSPPGVLNTAGTLQIWYGSGSPSTVNAIELATPTSGLPIVSTVDAVNDGNWHYVAFARQAGTSRSFLDGVLKQSAADVNNYTRLGGDGVLIGSRADFNLLTWFAGHIDEFHFSNVARYTATFTPPAGEETPDANTLTLLRGGVIDGSKFAKAATAPLIDYPLTGPATVKQNELRGQKVLDIYWGGPGRLIGTTKIKGTPNVPIGRRVRLIREVDGFCIAEVWSDSVTGEYEFSFIDPAQKYTVIAYYPEDDYRAVVADNLTPGPL